MSQAGLDINDLKELVTAAVQEARKPSPEEAAKEARRKATKAEDRASAAFTLAQLDAKQERCSHRKENGKFALSGQVMGNGLRQQICSFCQARFISRPNEGSPSGDLDLNQQPPFGPRLPVVEPSNIKTWLDEKLKSA